MAKPQPEQYLVVLRSMSDDLPLMLTDRKHRAFKYAKALDHKEMHRVCRLLSIDTTPSNLSVYTFVGERVTACDVVTDLSGMTLEEQEKGKPAEEKKAELSAQERLVNRFNEYVACSTATIGRLDKLQATLTFLRSDATKEADRIVLSSLIRDVESIRDGARPLPTGESRTTAYALKV